MSYFSRDEALFWELLDVSDSLLVIDNDSCYISYNYCEHQEEYLESQSFDFSPLKLATMFAEALGHAVATA